MAYHRLSVGRNGGDAETRVYLGLSYDLGKKSKTALLQYEKALKIDPGFPLTHYYLGLHYLKHSPRKAKKYLVRFLKLVKNQNDAGPLVRNAEKILKSS